MVGVAAAAARRPDFSACNSDNKRETLKATNTHDRKTRADTVTMNTAHSDVFLANLPTAIRETYEPIRMKQPNTVLLHMFDWFITKYGKTTGSNDCKWFEFKEFYCCYTITDNPCNICLDGATASAVGDFAPGANDGAFRTCANLIDEAKLYETGSNDCEWLEMYTPDCCFTPP
jgi:hypothetical protein